MWFLPPAGGIAAGTAASPVGVGVPSDGLLSTGCGCRGVGMPSRCLRGEARASEASGGEDTCGTSMAGRRNAHSLAGFARRASRYWEPKRMRLVGPGAIRDCGAPRHSAEDAPVPGAMPPAGGRNQMDNTPTPPRAVGSRGTGAGAPSSRTQASACARRVRHCGETRARLTAGARGTSRRVRRATARHHGTPPMDAPVPGAMPPAGGRNHMKHADIA